MEQIEHLIEPGLKPPALCAEISELSAPHKTGGFPESQFGHLDTPSILPCCSPTARYTGITLRLDPIGTNFVEITIDGAPHLEKSGLLRHHKSAQICGTSPPHHPGTLFGSNL